MSCINENRKRAGYENVARIAEKALRLVQDDIVIYRKNGKENEFAFCCFCEWHEGKGTAVKVLRQNRGHKSV